MSWLLRWAGPRLAIAGDRACLDQRRLFILPTAAGAAFAGLLAVLLLIAMNYNNSMVFAFTFLLAGVGINAMWQTHRNLLGLCVTIHQPVELFAWREHALWLSFAAGNRVRRALEIEFDAPSVQTSTVEFSAGDGARAELRLPPMARGLQTLPPLLIATRFPLGLFRAWSLLPFPTRVMVYPEPATQPPPLPMAPSAAGTNPGSGGSEDDFEDLRDYRPTDPPRRIAWRASARSDKLLSRTLHAGALPSAWLDWHALHGRGVEARLSILCRWVLEADQQGLRYGLRMPGHELAPARGPQHRRECLRLLALHGSASL